MVRFPSRAAVAATSAAGPDLSPIYGHRAVRLGALLAAGLALAVVASLQQTISVDEPILQRVQDVLPGAYEDVAWFFNILLRDTITPALWASTVVTFLILRRNDYAALFVIAVAAGPLTSLLKQIVDRPRPAGDFSIVHFPTDASFPSAHTTIAMAFYGLWFLIAPSVLPPRAVIPVRIVCAGAVLLTGLSRVWAGAHWPTDVLGGIVWGSFFLVLVLMTHPLCRKLNLPQPARSGVL